MNEIVKVFEGKEIMFKMVDGEVYAKANSMCDSVKLDNWKRSANTKRYIEALKNKASNNSVKITEFIISEEGVKGGSWIHEKLILNLARFVSVDFELWCDEIITELIREGEVSMKPKIPQTYAEALLEAGRLALENEQLVENNKKLEVENLVSKQIIADNEPKVNYYDRLLADTKTILGVNQIAKDYDLSGTKLNRILVEEKVQYFQNKTYLLYANYVGKGYTKSKPYELPNGEFKYHLYWTQKGRVLIHNILEKRGIHPIEIDEE